MLVKLTAEDSFPAQRNALDNSTNENVCVCVCARERKCVFVSETEKKCNFEELAFGIILGEISFRPTSYKKSLGPKIQ